MNRLKMFLSDTWAILKKTFAAWVEADPFRQSAVVAYYAIFSIPALLVIVIALAGLAFGREAVQGEISNQISAAIGNKTAEEIEDMIAKSSEQKSSIIATVVSVITLIVGSTGVFAQLQTTLNQIWNVKVSSKKIWIKAVKDRLLSFGLVLSIAFLLLVSLLITTALEVLSGWIKAYLPDLLLFLFKLLDISISFVVVSILFALMFMILPDVKIRWRNVWIGAIVTTGLFILGKFGLGVYFAKAEPASAYGAAGSIILVMLWVSYSCMIFFFGAEFTKQYALHHGYHIVPDKDAELITTAEKEKRK